MVRVSKAHAKSLGIGSPETGRATSPTGQGWPVELPIPPSANRLWRSTKTPKGKLRFYKEKEYESWLKSAVGLLRCTASAIPGPVLVKIVIRGGEGFPDFRDLDNCIKAVVDGLRHAQRIDGDTVKTVREIVARYEPSDGRPAACLVSVHPVAHVVDQCQDSTGNAD